jgi:60 kDa SS-A/Ro ribonucleoprotein
MSNVVRRLFGSRPAGYEAATGVNHEGFPSFARSLQEQYIQTLLTNTLGHTFYASQGENYAATLDVHRRMMAADPQFAARAIVYARERGTMRLQPIVGLVFLSMTDRTLFRAIFGRVIQTPGDLLHFVQIVRSKQIRPGLGRAVKDAINDWLNGLSEYHAIKYGSDAGAKLSLRDVLRLTHPQPVDNVRNALFVYLTDRETWREMYEDRVFDLLPQLAAVEQLKRSENPIEQRALIEAGRLPYEAVTGAIRPDREMWSFLLRQMPYFALLRHLNTLQRAGVLADDREAAYVAERLGDLLALRKAKVLPFRLHAAWIAFQPTNGAEELIKAALERALEGSFANLPQIGGVVAIAPDVSGSMGGAIHHPSKVRYIDVAAIFAGALLRSSQRSIVLPFEDRVVDIKLKHNLPLMEVVQRLASIGGGGTAVSAPVSKLLAERKAVDVFIGITDNVEWARDNYGGVGFLPTWRTYRKKVAPHAQAFLITIAPYANAVAPPDEPGVHYIYGWADHVPAYIAQTLRGYAGQVEAVRRETVGT